MARTSKPQRISRPNPAAKVRTVVCVARTMRAHADNSRSPHKVPSITITGAWLRAAGFAPGRPCHVRAFAPGQLVIYQPA
jgi:hypothetical protein